MQSLERSVLEAVKNYCHKREAKETLVLFRQIAG